MFTGTIIENQCIIQMFPVVSRDVISNFNQFVPAKYAYIAHAQSKDMGTLLSRQQHFVQFLEQMEMDVTLSSYTPYSQTLNTIVFLIFLPEGYTCKDISIRKLTLQGYMRGVTLYSMTDCDCNIF